MKDFEALIVSFGFKEGPFIIVFLCIMMLLVNLMGGLFSNILLAMRSSPVVKRPLSQRISFQLAASSQFFFVAYIIFYHTVLTSEIAVAQVIYWIFFILAAPLMALLGAQIGYLSQKKKIDQLKSKKYAAEWGQESGGTDDNKRSGDERREETDRRQVQVDLVSEEQRTAESRRSGTERRLAA